MGAQPPSPPRPVPGVGSHRCHACRAGTLRTTLTGANPCQRTGSCSPCRAQPGRRLEWAKPCQTRRSWSPGKGHFCPQEPKRKSPCLAGDRWHRVSSVPAGEHGADGLGPSHPGDSVQLSQPLRCILTAPGHRWQPPLLPQPITLSLTASPCPAGPGGGEQPPRTSPATWTTASGMVRGCSTSWRLPSRMARLSSRLCPTI